MPEMQNKLGAHSGSYQPYRLEDALHGIASAGFRYVELSSIRGVVEHVPLDGGDGELSGVRKNLEFTGLTPVSLSGHSDLTAESGIRDASLALHLCNQLGIPILNTAVGGAFNEQEDEGAFLSNMEGLAAEAEKMGVVIAIEIHGTLTATGAKTRRLVDKVGHPSVRINYDTANCEYFAGVGAEQDLPDAFPLVAHCHLKDHIGGQREWNFPAIGKGTINFARLLGLFREAGYAGPFTVELEFQGEPWPALDAVTNAMVESCRHLRSLGLGC